MPTIARPQRDPPPSLHHCEHHRDLCLYEKMRRVFVMCVPCGMLWETDERRGKATPSAGAAFRGAERLYGGNPDRCVKSGHGKSPLYEWRRQNWGDVAVQENTSAGAARRE